MGRLLVVLSVLGMALATAHDLAAEDPAQNPYRQRLKPTGFTLQAVTLTPRAIGTTVLRHGPSLAVAVRVALEDYVPRGLEPTLLIDGTPIRAVSGVTAVQGRTTTQSFLVEEPTLLREGATLLLQMGPDVGTRVQIPGVLRRDAIAPPDPGELQRFGLPSLPEWLDGRRQ